MNNASTYADRHITRAALLAASSENRAAADKARATAAAYEAIASYYDDRASDQEDSADMIPCRPDETDYAVALRFAPAN